MSLLTEAQSLAKRPGGTCGVAILVRSLTEQEQAELEEALSSRISAKAISDALAGRGHQIKYQTINRHRAGGCACR